MAANSRRYAGGNAAMQGPLTVVNEGTAQGTSMHTHGGVQIGSGNTEIPN